MQFVIEFGPVLAFFIAYKTMGLMPATAVLIGLTLLSTAIVYVREKRIPLALLATAGIVALFGGLTLWFDDEMFIKLKPTIINLVFAGILAVGLMRGQGWLKKVMGTLDLPDAAWLTLSRRYMWFFLSMAAANELVWRCFSTDIWVSFKLFGMLGASLVFSMWQLWPYISAQAKADAQDESSE